MKPWNFSSPAHRAFAAFLVSVCVILASGCGGKTDERTVRLMMWDIVAARETVDKAVAGWEREHPGYRVRVEKVPIGQYEEKLIILLGAKDAPDVMIVPEARYPEYVRQSALYDVSSRIRKSGVIDSTIPDKALRGLAAKDGVRAVPMGVKGLLWAIPASARHPGKGWDLIELLVGLGYKPLTKAKVDYSRGF